MLAVWEISEALAARAASLAREVGGPTRYVLTVDRVERDGEEPVTVARVDLPDALGGESWYVDLPRGGGRARARIGLDRGGAFEPLLESRWAPVPPEGSCAEEAPWEISAEHAAWLAEQGALARALGRIVSSPTGPFPMPWDPQGKDA